MFRLLQHLDENPAFSMENLQILVLDEADREECKAALNFIQSRIRILSNPVLIVR
jgi:superfamily II DNA/RNA helicase